MSDHEEFFDEEDMSLPDLTGFGFADEADPTIKAKEFEEWPDEKVKVKGIYEFITQQDDVPAFKQGTDGTLYCLVRLMLASGEAGPPMRVSPAELPLVAKAFGGSLSKVPRNRTTPQFQMVMLERANEGGIVREVQVKGGYAKLWSLEGADLPVSRMFRFKVNGFLTKKSDVVAFETDIYGNRVLNVFLEVAGDENGNESLYDGARVMSRMEDPFDGVKPRGNGFEPNAKVAKNGGSPMSVQRMKNFLWCFWPEIGEYRDQWQSDASRSRFGVDEAADPIKVIAAKVIENGYKAKGYLSPDKNGKPVLRLEHLFPLTSDVSVPEEKAENDLVTPVLPALDENKRALRTTINDLAQIMLGSAAFDVAEDDTRNKDYYSLNAATGKVWAKEHLKPLWVANQDKLPEKMYLVNLSEQQATLLLGELLSVYGSHLNQPQAEAEEEIG